jgi:hypothetical protein
MVLKLHLIYIEDNRHVTCLWRRAVQPGGMVD